MTSHPERVQIASWIEEAVASGARRAKACAIIGLSIRTLQRWCGDDEIKADGRPLADRPEPKNKLTTEEREEVLRVCNEPQYASLPPSQIVPTLADQGVYMASESTLYRVLIEADQHNHRGRARKASTASVPTSYAATEKNQVWSWDITYLPSRVKGQYYYLYMVEDIFSRKAVGSEVYDSECGELAAKLMQRTCMAERCFNANLVLHSDNGSPMKSVTLRAKLEELGIAASWSRPRVSNDNPYSESLFRTLKYCPQWPSQGFASLEEARQWVHRFVDWYNNEHKHSRIGFVTPSQRHSGEDKAVLESRHRLYEQAKMRNPARWSGSTRNWDRAEVVMLNPERLETELRQTG